MRNLLKITTKPIRISVKVDKGKFVKVEQVIKLQNTKQSMKQESIVHVNNVKKHDVVQELPKNIKLNEMDNNINKIIKQSYTQEESRNITYLSPYNTMAKIEPISNEIKFELKYQPGDLDFIVNQYSEIEFEYIGDPIYTPASANPNKEK